MKSIRLLCAFPLALLSSCAAQVAGGPGSPSSCNDLAGQVYQGEMHDSAGNDLAAVTVSLDDTHSPGFKHNVNVIMVGSPPPPQPQYDGECVDGTPMTFNIYTPVAQPPPFGTKLATWNIAFVVPQGYVFHATDPGSHLFSHGAQGDFK